MTRPSFIPLALLLIIALLGGARVPLRAQSGRTTAVQPAAKSTGDSDKAQGQQQPPPSASQPALKGNVEPPPTGPVPDEEIVRINTDLTNLLFTAVDKNKRFVTTLRQEDIRVKEDGVQQEMFTFQRETDRPLSLVILIDVSASQQGTLPDEKRAAQLFVETVIRSAKDAVAIISFTGDATLEQGLTGDRELARKAIDRVEIVLPPNYDTAGIIMPGSAPNSPEEERKGTTAIWDAVWVTSEDLLARTSDNRRRAIILLTDGVDTSSRYKRSEAIDHALKSDTVVYAIGIGDSRAYEGVDKGTLRKLSEQTGGRAFFPKDDWDLRAAFTQIQDELRSQYSVAYSPSNKSRDGSYRRVEIEIVNPELRKQKLRLAYRPGYYAKSRPSSIQPAEKSVKP